MARQSIPERLKSGGARGLSLRQIFMGQTRKDPSLKAGTRIGHKPERVKHERKMSAKQISNYAKSKTKSLSSGKRTSSKAKSTTSKTKTTTSRTKSTKSAKSPKAKPAKSRSKK